MVDASRNRALSAEQFEAYADLLSTIRIGQLESQEGFTAEQHRHAFQTGERTAREIASMNSAKFEAYTRAHNQINELRSELHTIAQDGRQAISAIQASPEPDTAKFAQIVQVVIDCQMTANMVGAKHADAALAAIQSILSAVGSDVSAREFASTNGFGKGKTFRSPDRDPIESAVRRLAPEIASTPTPRSESHGSDSVGHPALPDAVQPVSPIRPQLGTAAQFQAQAFPDPSESQLSASVSATVPSAQQFGLECANGMGPSTTPHTSHSASSEYSSFSDSDAAARGGLGIDPPIERLAALSSVDDLGENFQAEKHTGVPPSGSTEATPAATSSIHIPHSPAADAPPPAASGINSQPFESTLAAVPADKVTSIAAATETHQSLVTPTATAAFAPATHPSLSAFTLTPPPAAQGPLLAYGADLKPPTATSTSVTPLTPAAASSAPISTASGAAPTGGPAVVRPQPSPSSIQSASAAAVTGRAFAAASAGAAVGATRARSTAEDRLHRLLLPVARQEPRLRWAIADLADGSTVLVTDVAGGWIPPHIDIPAGVDVLQPAARGNSMAALVSGAVLTAVHEPGQRLSPEAEPVRMSISARNIPPVDDLGWELAQATKWRDGLPRLAHTLARAAFAKTGFLDSEVELLRDQLNVVAGSVLREYPGKLNSAQLGNWQLLATIDALVSDEKATANYHFSWFRAQALIREQRR